MKKDNNRAYKVLDSKLQFHLENSMNAVPIDEDAKDRIWNNLYNEMQEERLNRKFRVRRNYRVAFAVCIVLVLLVSVDLSSNASLFKRLLTSVNDNVINFHTRDSLDYQQNLDEDLVAKIQAINEKNKTGYVTPMIPETYYVDEIIDRLSTLLITLKNEDGDILNIVQNDVNIGAVGTTARYNKDLFVVEVLNNNGIEYTMLKSDNLNISLFVVENIEFEIIGKYYTEVFEVALSLQSQF